jgi:hypothetical protein
MIVAAVLVFVQDIEVDEKGKKLSFAAAVAKQDHFEQLQGLIEYVLVMPGGKEYESLFVCPVDPLKLVEAMKRIGLKPGRPAREEDGKRLPPEGSRLRVLVEWKDGEKERREPVESFVQDLHAKGPMKPVDWVFAGSKEAYDPESDKNTLKAAITRNLMSLYQEDDGVLIQTPVQPKDPHSYKVNPSVRPAEGTAVRIVFEFRAE